jgi:hypothetical protein
VVDFGLDFVAGNMRLGLRVYDELACLLSYIAGFLDSGLLLMWLLRISMELDCRR